ncbi:MAG: DUF177 domain-containing protein [Deltaproteobacteria bacterium]|nr:DUF177 domain-containing protein [Deltaproteobacteria bacterium]
MEAVKDNLIFSLDAFPESGLSLDFVLAPSILSPFLQPDPDLGINAEIPDLVTSMRGHLDLRLTGKRLWVQGTFAVKTQMTCARCLTAFIGKVADNIDEVVELGAPSGLGAAEEPETFIPTKDGFFDLTPLMGELFWLSWPIRALCRPECAGLCPHCGANLNEGACECQKATITRH